MTRTIPILPEGMEPVRYRFPVYIIQGAQYGSEGKGQIAAIYANNKAAVAVVRTGSINAGHTVTYKGLTYKMQQLPTAWVNDDPDCHLVLGPGAYVHRPTLAAEVTIVSEALGRDIRKQLLIDRRCAVHSDEAEARGRKSGRHEAMGATGKGSSDAVIERMTARANFEYSMDMTFGNRPDAGGLEFRSCIVDTVRFLHDSLARGPVVLEGTQGAMLDFITGPYPYVTNRAVSSAAWLAYAGLPPTVESRVVLVARTYPIRVAGNSGPMPNELSWPQLYRIIRTKAAIYSANSHKVPQIADTVLTAYEAKLHALIEAGGGPEKLPPHRWTIDQRMRYRRLLSDAPTQALWSLEPKDRDNLLEFFERTTVTNKLRRVAALDEETLLDAIMMNGCREMWLTFLNYEFPTLWGSESPAEVKHVAALYLGNIEKTLSVPIVGVSTERHRENHLWLK